MHMQWARVCRNSGSIMGRATVSTLLRAIQPPSYSYGVVLKLPQRRQYPKSLEITGWSINEGGPEHDEAH